MIPFTASFIANRTFPGAQIAVISSGGKTHFETVIGNLTYPGDRYNVPVTEDVIYDIASLSKVVGATSCAMKLYDMGLLNLDDQWVKYVPEGNNNGKDKITIRNLLLHNAGFAPDYPFFGYYTNVTQKIFLDWVYSTDLDYPVGTKTIYSDVSMVALQLVIERITGKSLAVFAQENVFMPLGMTSTFYNPPKWTKTCAPTTDVPNYRG